MRRSSMDHNSIVDLLKRYFRRYELRKQRAVWLAFGVDYEKEKQEAIWKQFQEKRKNLERGEGG